MKRRARAAAGPSVAAVLAAFAVGWPAGTSAAPATRPDTLAPPPIEEAYRRAIEDGVTEYGAGHFEEARSLFRHAHEISPNARTYRGLGMTAFELRDYVAAVRNLSAALQDKRKPLTPEQRKDAEQLLDRSRMFVDTYHLTVEPAGAHVLIDGRAPELERDGNLLLGFGTHTVEADAPARVPLFQSLEVRGGANKELRLVLDRVPQPELGPSTSSARAGLRGSGAPASSNRGAAVCLWVALGAAALSGAGGVYWYDQQQQLDSCRNPAPNMRCTTEDRLRTQRNFAVIGTLTTGAAAVTLGLIGILSWDGASPKKTGKRQSALDCLPNGYGLTCGGRF